MSNPTPSPNPIAFLDSPWRQDAPLERIAGESKVANQALWDYWQMGAGRSLRKLFEYYTQRSSSDRQAEKPPTKKLRTLYTWSHRNHWQARIAGQTRLKREQDEHEWNERRRQLREADWSQADRLRQLSNRILDEAPKFIKAGRRLVKGEGGKPDREIVTVALDGQLAIRAAETASKLARLAAEMETDRQKMVVALEKEVEAILDVLKEAADDDTYNRVLAWLSSQAGGE